MTISRKIIGGYAIILALLVLVVGIAFYATGKTQSTYERFIDVNERLVDGSNELRFQLRSQVGHYRGMLLYPDMKKQYQNDLQADYRNFDKSLEAMTVLAITGEGRAMLQEIKQLQQTNEQLQQRVIALSQQGKRAEALALGASEVRPLNLIMLGKLDRFREREMRLEADGRTEIEATSQRFMLVMGMTALLAVIVGLCIGIYLGRTITRQLRAGIDQLSTSSAEILATTTQVAAGAAETASAVSQTTATVEEVKQTAQLANQKARSVSDGAQKVSQISQTGSRSVEESIACMQRIQEQMESIAESIVHLSEQSQAIGEIIATVNDLAEQSNLLAVNAAIEAAKAGEQGKGFVVVAQEVKSLAEQSKQATSQVRTLLGDIQRATSTAVLATEQGSKAVQAGMIQSAQTGEAIRQLAGNVNDTAQAATQITASSQQQMVGMDQVAMAMESIKLASVQNMSGTRQAEVAAQNLHELGLKLSNLIGGGS